MRQQGGRKPRFTNGSAIMIVAAGTLLNLYWGWARDKRCNLESRLVQEELAREQGRGASAVAGARPCPPCEPCERCSCPVCPVFPDCDSKGVAGRREAAKLPCPNDCNSAGSCDAKTGTCRCSEGRVGKDCSIADTDTLHSLLTVLLPTGSAGGIPSRPKWLKSLRKRYAHKAPKVLAIRDPKEEDEEDSGVTYVEPREGISGRRLGAQLNDLLNEAETELVLVVADSQRIGGETDLEMAVDMFKETSVDLLGGLVEDTDRLLRAPCFDLVHKMWQLHHRRPPFGYRRHEKFVMYCDTTSPVFLARKSVLHRLKGFNETYSGMTVVSDLFLRVRHGNSAVQAAARNATSPYHRLADIPTRLPGYVMVGVASEVIFPVSNMLKESFTRSFALRHQIEAYFDYKGQQVGSLQCLKPSGKFVNLQHSVDGRYAPICHRFTRQRDFVMIYDMWMDPEFHGPEADGLKFGVSVHHGNLFGALRMGEELLWETDGDFDLVSFNYTNEQLSRQGRKLMEKLRAAGFDVKAPHAGKVTYLNVLRNVTDFQISLRSTQDPMTQGKPPHKHTSHLMYQGRKVYVNGFANPWRGVRLDKGHDYRDKYLAQQPWVAHFTQDSITCKGSYHNGCLPSCNNPTWLLDHNYCSDDDLTNSGMRNPYLWHSDPEHERVWLQSTQMYQ